MEREKIVEDLDKLGRIFETVSNNGSEPHSPGSPHDKLLSAIHTAAIRNPWYTPENSLHAIKAWANNLTVEKLTAWLQPYGYSKNPRTIALILAGNIPLVGFHDIISVLLSGHRALIKTSSDDEVLTPAVIGLLHDLDPAYGEMLQLAEGPMRNFDAAIATGSDNSARYFLQYFGKYPHIIRKNRTSLAVLTGKEKNEELQQLGADIFTYFGMGCRNVSHLLVPGNYDFTAFFEAIFPFGEQMNHNKYLNNHSYHKAIFLLEQIPFLDNNFLMLRENQELFSPLSVLHYSFYTDEDEVSNYILDHREKIQCVTGRGYIPFGQTQQPELSDYADNVDTLRFLEALPKQ